MMEFRQEWSSPYTDLEDRHLLREIDRLREDMESTQKWIKELEDNEKPMEYINKKMAKLAFGFAREKYFILSQEAHRRGLLS